MKQEPDIVKELRQEEQCGRLQSLFRRKDEEIDYSVLPYDRSPERQRGGEETPQGSLIQGSVEHEQRLLAAEERYEKIFRLSPEAIVLLDKSGVFLEVNDRLYDWLGYKPDEVLGKSFMEVPLFSVDEKIKAKNKLAQRFTGKEVPPYELEFITKNQEKRVGLVRGATIKDEWGNITQGLIMISDITEQKDVEDARKDIAAIVESTDDAIIGKTLDGIITSWNPAAERIYGYTKQEVIGQPISLLLPPGATNDIPALLQRIEQGERITRYETIRQRKNGEQITVSLTISPIKDDTGMIVGASTIARDVSKQKTMEQELSFRNRILDLLPDAIFLCDGEDRLLYVNNVAYASRGYTKDEILRMHFRDLVSLKDRKSFASHMQTLDRSEQQFELEHLTKHGNPFRVLVHTWLIDHDNGKLALHLVHAMPPEIIQTQTKQAPLQKKQAVKQTHRPVKTEKQHRPKK
jgi:sigma-B regulation protein RsbU (phosphoserine phosphatase)